MKLSRSLQNRRFLVVNHMIIGCDEGMEPFVSNLFAVSAQFKVHQAINPKDALGGI